jgi:hypothetical protein
MEWMIYGANGYNRGDCSHPVSSRDTFCNSFTKIQ